MLQKCCPSLPTRPEGERVHISPMRPQGVLIVHAPSDTMDFYKGTPQRKRGRTLGKQHRRQRSIIGEASTMLSRHRFLSTIRRGL